MFYASFFYIEKEFLLPFSYICPAFYLDYVPRYSQFASQTSFDAVRSPYVLTQIVLLSPHRDGSYDTFCIDFRFAEFVSLLPHIFTILAIPFHILFYFCRILFMNGAQVASEIQFHKMHWSHL